ncbi:phosphatases II [Mytilinidion resinicola]|uniref:Phosphatases II n=1 Tax=Mytilinidion resinicola TaxID=574789 RepID=A0A6A6Z8J4_9PEZI|nr:phosphatases II [Mytilinidion resinicola]KAF2817340.1 phosphatases II [Mytilinidion resinicola]
MMQAVHEEATMSDRSLLHRRHHEYVYRLPTPPRIVIPPPTLANELPEVEIDRPSQRSAGDVDVSFLNSVDFSSVVSRNSLIDWSYERRRQAQMVLPFIFLGPMVAAKDMTFLQNEGITMILAIRPRATGMVGAFKAAEEAGIHTATLEVPDYHTLISTFPRATRLINEHLSSIFTSDQSNPRLGKVFVFCESGNEKSAAIVAAYLMEMLGNIDYIKAIQICQAQRFCVNFDDTLKNLLQSYWDILLAQRSVAKASYGLLEPEVFRGQVAESIAGDRSGSIRHKRSLDDSYDDDMEMEDAEWSSDDARFRAREAAPFQDVR